MNIKLKELVELPLIKEAPPFDIKEAANILRRYKKLYEAGRLSTNKKKIFETIRNQIHTLAASHINEH